MEEVLNLLVALLAVQVDLEVAVQVVTELEAQQEQQTLAEVEELLVVKVMQVEQVVHPHPRSPRNFHPPKNQRMAVQVEAEDRVRVSLLQE